MELTEKKEVVVGCYSKTLDKDMSYRKARLTREEMELLDDDQDFQDRLEYFLITNRENLMLTLTNLTKHESPKISLQATMELGKILYPESFISDRASSKQNTITDREVEDFFNNECK